MKRANALNRTVLLMRDFLRAGVADDVLLDALAGTRVALVGDAANLASHSAQSAFVTAAMLAGRCGLSVSIDAADVELAGPQPPLRKRRLVEALVDIGPSLLPGLRFDVGRAATADLAVVFGDAHWNGTAAAIVHLGADDWSAWISAAPRCWTTTAWPIGGLAAGGLAGGEAFKAAMRKLAHLRHEDACTFGELFAPASDALIALASPKTPKAIDLGSFDIVSAGAVTHAALYGLARVSGIRGVGRVFEHDRLAISNANRYSLMFLDVLDPAGNGPLKAEDLARAGLGGIVLEPICRYFDADLARNLGPLAPVVLVGVDDIPARWEVQRASPGWLAVGATSHYQAVLTLHDMNLACARCGHYADDPAVGPVATASFVSFWAGLMQATAMLQRAAGVPVGRGEQMWWLSPLRPEAGLRKMPIPFHFGDCPCRLLRAAAD